MRTSARNCWEFDDSPAHLSKPLVDDAEAIGGVSAGDEVAMCRRISSGCDGNGRQTAAFVGQFLTQPPAHLTGTEAKQVLKAARTKPG